MERIRLSFLKELLNPFKEWRIQFFSWLSFTSFFTILALYVFWELITAHSTVPAAGYAFLYLLFLFVPYLNVLRDALTDEVKMALKSQTLTKKSLGCLILLGSLGLIPLSLYLLVIGGYWIIF